MNAWEDWQVEALIKCVKEGQSASECGDIVGKSRNACIGKALRLGINFASNPGGRPQRRISRPKTRYLSRPQHSGTHVHRKPTTASVSVQATIVPVEPEIAPYEPPAPSDRLSVLHLSDKTCKWPLNDGPEYEFCGCEPVPGKPYCAHHSSIAYTIYTKHSYAYGKAGKNLDRFVAAQGRAQRSTVMALDADDVLEELSAQ